MKIFATFAAVVAVAVFNAVPAFAQTPDGDTPANEGVCDELIGGTPGLYGLCVAYCEAQDLDEFGVARVPNERLLANYDKRKEFSDPDMPCIKAPCPCWEPTELAAAYPNGADFCGPSGFSGIQATAIQPGAFKLNQATTTDSDPRKGAKPRCEADFQFPTLIFRLFGVSLSPSAQRGIMVPKWLKCKRARRALFHQ